MTERNARARLSLDGLSLGDAFGERFFLPPARLEPLLTRRELPDRPLWPWTDDTAMAAALVAHLARHGRVEQATLAQDFLASYAAEPERGYGGGMHQLFTELAGGRAWRDTVHALFGGEGSYGNGAAMRVAPLGAFFADDLERVVTEASAQAEVTHAHREGVAGAIAVAVAAATAWRHRTTSGEAAAAAIWLAVLERTPPGAVLRGLASAAELAPGASVQEAVHALGNGSRVTAQDTVPFVVWSVCRWLGHGSFEEAMWQTVSGLGDRDTTCAMVGGIVALHLGDTALPAAWLARREPLPGAR